MPRSFNTPASNGSLSGSVTNQWVHEGWRITSSTSPPALIMLNVFDSWYCNYPFRSLQLWKHEWQWCFFFLFFVLALNVPVLLSCCAVKYVWRWHCVRNGKKHWRKTIIRTDRAERMQIWSRTDKQHKHMHTHTHTYVCGDSQPSQTSKAEFSVVAVPRNESESAFSGAIISADRRTNSVLSFRTWS